MQETKWQSGCVNMKRGGVHRVDKSGRLTGSTSSIVEERDVPTFTHTQKGLQV